MSLCFAARRPSAAFRSFLCFLWAATPRLMRVMASPYRTFEEGARMNGDECNESSFLLPYEVRRQLADQPEVTAGDEPFAGVTPLPARRLMRVEVALVRLHARELAAPGRGETLLRTAMALDLGHGVMPPRAKCERQLYGLVRPLTRRGARRCRGRRSHRRGRGRRLRSSSGSRELRRGGARRWRELRRGGDRRRCWLRRGS